jgi:RPA family protein
MFKKLLLYSLFLVCTTYSQVGGKYTYQFLNLVTSPRQAALGGKITIYDDDVNQVNFNPATINVKWTTIWR